MNSLIEDLATIDVVIDSPDETIQARLTRASGITLEFEEPIGELHTERSLEDQLEAVLNEILPEYERQVQELRADRYGTSVVDEVPRGREKHFIELCDGIKFTAKSPTAAISIDWEGSNNIVVAINERSLSDLTHDDFITAANGLLQAALNVYSMCVQSAHRTAYLDHAPSTMRGRPWAA